MIKRIQSLLNFQNEAEMTHVTMFAPRRVVNDIIKAVEVSTGETAIIKKRQDHLNNKMKYNAKGNFTEVAFLAPRSNSNSSDHDRRSVQNIIESHWHSGKYKNASYGVG